MSEKIYFVILNWNLAEDTIACVHSLVQTGVHPDQIIVVDNGSVDDSMRQLQDEFSDNIHLIKSAENRGFAGGNNLGIKYAFELGADWVFLLNNDTFVALDFFDELNKTFNHLEKFDVIAPIIFYANDPDVVWSMGDKLIPGTLFTRQLLRNKKVPDKLPPFVEVDFVTGCGLLVKRNVIEEIGYLDERFFMYGEDAEFCWRAKTVGFRIAVATNAKIWHKVARSGNKIKEKTVYWRFRNQIWFYRLSANNGQYVLMILGTFLRMTGLIIKNILYGRKHLNTAIISGWKEGWFGIMENKFNYH